MKKYLACLAILILATEGVAAETAVVTGGKINVRGQAKLNSEVVTQLQEGDTVTVLERIPIEKPKPGDPTVWAKIKLPANTPVWAFAPFIKNGEVTANRLNLRAGPGENYSVIGRVTKGTKVKEIRTVESWKEIEAPDETYAFVDSSLLKPTGGTEAETGVAAAPPGTTGASPAPTAAETPKVESTGTPAVAAAPAPVQPDAQPPITNITPEPEVKPVPDPLTSIPAGTQPPPLVEAAPAPTLPTPAATLPEVAPSQPEVDPGPAPKRVVRREGIVKVTKSIQAPTWYALVHPETGRTINYLNAEKLGVDLSVARGQKVIVLGEEGIDPRWPKYPVMELESIETAP